MSKKRKIKKIAEEQEKGEPKKLSDEEYTELLRKVKTRQYTLLHKGYVVIPYDLKNFKEIYDEEIEKRKRLTKEQKKKLKPVLDTIAENSKMYDWKMAKAAAEIAGMSTKEWMRDTISELYTDTFIKPGEFDIKKAAKVRQVVFDYYLQQTDDYDIAHAEYVTRTQK